jgi:hypothetical protein
MHSLHCRWIALNSRVWALQLLLMLVVHDQHVITAAAGPVRDGMPAYRGEKEAKEALAFLRQHLPARDVNMTLARLVADVELALQARADLRLRMVGDARATTHPLVCTMQARHATSWAARVPWRTFLEFVLPHR